MCEVSIISCCAGLPETKKHMVSNLSTVAVVPITRDVPLTNFTKYLCAAINVIGTFMPV